MNINLNTIFTNKYFIVVINPIISFLIKYRTVDLTTRIQNNIRF